MSTDLNQKISLPALNLPQFDPQLQQVDGKLLIFDFLRKKQLVLTPEEWVRQHWIHFLVNQHKYPRGLFSLEKGLKYNQLNKRTDLVVFDQESKPYLLVECKAPNIKIDEKTLRQIMTYNKRLNCPNLVLSNGLKHLIVQFSEAEGRFIQQLTLPPHP
jgi:hypothetical protein